jgi:hypothetical protein
MKLEEFCLNSLEKKTFSEKQQEPIQKSDGFKWPCLVCKIFGFWLL